MNLSGTEILSVFRVVELAKWKQYNEFAKLNDELIEKYKVSVVRVVFSWRLDSFLSC